MLGRYATALITAATAVALTGSPASASIIQVDNAAFTASAGLITFNAVNNKFRPGTFNPTYTPADYGGDANATTVTFGGFFTGQSLGTADTCPTGAAPTGCVVGSPSGPLTLDPNSPETIILGDSARPETSPVLAGTGARINSLDGPVAIKFSVPQYGVGLDGGYFDSIGSTAISAFDASGNEIGTVVNSKTGVEFLGLVTGDGSATIAGLLFHLVGPEVKGFDVDNIRFGVQGQVASPVPEPASMIVLASALVGLGMIRRRGA